MQIEATYLNAVGRVTSATVVSGFLVLTGDSVTLRYEPVGQELG
jgi:hypothetical protein